MFSKAKRFESVLKTEKKEVDNQKVKNKPTTVPASKLPQSANKKNFDTRSQCSSTHSVKSFVTPKPVKTPLAIKPKSSAKKTLPLPKSTKLKDDIVSAQDVEIRNKDLTIAEYIAEIEELKSELFNIKKQIKGDFDSKPQNDVDNLNQQVSQITIDDKSEANTVDDSKDKIEELNNTIKLLEIHCHGLEQELCSRQVELASVEDMIGIRDSLCKDLQNKLTDMETCLEETKQRLEMVKGHHALALEANESIRREYKAELETLKAKVEEEKQSIINKAKVDQESIKIKYQKQIESIKDDHQKEKHNIITNLQQQLITKDNEMKAKLEQIDEATHEKLRLCEIQFEERCRNIQDHWTQQDESIQYLNKETRDLKYSLNIAEERNMKLQSEINNFKAANDKLLDEKLMLGNKINDMKDEYKRKLIDCENEMNKLTAKVDSVLKEKNKFELSLSVTRDIVDVLTMRLRESDSDIDVLESNVQSLTNDKKSLAEELDGYKNTLNNTMMECNEYKEALVNILKSKSVLAKEHTRIMEHNVSLFESLQNVEFEAYRELGSIKNELLEDVELIKIESATQIKKLKDEVEHRRLACEAAREHAELATVMADHGRELLAQAAMKLTQLESENSRLLQQIEDQQSLVVELSLLRQENEELSLLRKENEELSMTVGKQASLIEKMKLEAEKKVLAKPKSPLVNKKSLKMGKENQIVLSPLRERNH